MRKFGLFVVLVAVAVMFAVPAFAGTSCECKPCKPCQPCVTCNRPCNPLQSTADHIQCMQRPCEKCTIVNPFCRIAETLCPGPGKERNKLKPFYCCEPCQPCPRPCKPCPKPCPPCK